MKRITSLLTALMIVVAAGSAALSAAWAAPKKEFNIAWTIYVGWMPWPYAAETGIVKKWADKYGITINVTQINDYVELVNQYTAGKFDGVTVTNMDALTIPAAGGVDTTRSSSATSPTATMASCSRRARRRRHQGPEDQHGRAVGVALSARPRADDREAEGEGHQGRQHLGRRHRRRLQVEGLDRGDDLEPAADGGAGRARRHAGVQLQQDPRRDHRHAGGEYRDAQGQSQFRQGARRHLVRDDGGDADPGEKGKAAREAMAKLSGTDLAGFEAQLKTTRMFYTAEGGADLRQSPDLAKTMDSCARSASSTTCWARASRARTRSGLRSRPERPWAAREM